MFLLKRLLFIACLVISLASLGHGTLNLNKAVESLTNVILPSKTSNCSPALVSCPCGRSTDSVMVAIPQCTKFRGFRAKCGPCNGVTADKICPHFQRCLECSSDDGGKCVRCPSGLYGRFCENECSCQNGAECNILGDCLCRNGFEGKFCEIKTGCLRFSGINEPLKAEYHTPDNPSSVRFSCPQGFELIGTEVVTCLPDREWSNSPPKCQPQCPLLSEPANGSLKYSGARLVGGTTAEAWCFKGYQMIGGALIRCQEDGTWNADLPRCERSALCPNPEMVEFGRFSQSSPEDMKIGEHYLEGSQIRYDCQPGFQLFGVSNLICTKDGTWSPYPPTCIKAATLIPDCETRGSEVVEDIGVPVRILCPPECAKNVAIWGTSIYRVRSAVCVAAVHSGKVTNSGGQINVINNGAYTSFAGSSMNNVQSLNYEGRDGSFRFDKAQSPDNSVGDCPNGLEDFGESCGFISSTTTTNSKANATCINLGLHLFLPQTSDDQIITMQLLRNKGVTKFWTGLEELVPNNGSNGAFIECQAAVVQDLNLVWEPTSCDQELPFLCVHNHSSNRLASCEDPGELADGFSRPVGKVGELYYVGSSIEYSCETLHYLKGASKIYCLRNGTWSFDKPTCIKVDTCEEPPVPYGGYVVYQKPSEMVQRTAITAPRPRGISVARLPAGLEAKPPTNITKPASTPGPEQDIPLPPGRKLVGTRATYSCESRYYTLVGSKSRRCEKQGQWSGRPATCIPICGRSDSARSPFIVNGNASDIGQWPWQAGVARYFVDHDVWYVLCGGSLLNERWVITAAHCVTYTGTTLTIDPDRFRVYLGKYHRDDNKDDEFVQVKAIREIHIHPDYEPQIFDADIALLLLETPVQLNTRVQPVCLPTEQGSSENLSPGSKGVVTGWGSNENGTNSETLQQAVVPVISNDDCEEGYEQAGLSLTVTENMFCAGYKEGRVDSCSGDSGGPVVFLDESAKQKKWMIEGIVSWGSPTGCGNANQYGGYTRVIKFLDWIHLYF